MMRSPSIGNERPFTSSAMQVSHYPSETPTRRRWNSKLTATPEKTLPSPRSNLEQGRVSWDKVGDTLSVPFPKDQAPLTKRGILSKLAKVYDPLGLAAPWTLTGKCI